MAIDKLLKNANLNSEALIYILGWYIFSVSISVYNKWMFGGSLDFKYPIFVTSFHQFCLMVLSTIVLWRVPHLRPLVNEVGSDSGAARAFWQSLKIAPAVYAMQILPCALASTGDIGLSNVSFKFVSLSLYTMLKTTSLLFVLFFGLIFKLERFNWRLLVIVGVMTISVMMMLKTPSDNKEAGGRNGFGIAMVIGASIMSGLRWSFTQLLLKNNPHTKNPIATIMYLSPSMCISLFVLGLFFEGWFNFTSSPIWETKGVITTMLLMILPGILAFMMTLCEFKLLAVAQVMTLSVAGIFKELLTIVLGALIFKDRLSFINCIGLALTFCDILWYHHHRYKENSEQPKYEIVDSQERGEVQQDTDSSTSRELQSMASSVKVRD